MEDFRGRVLFYEFSCETEAFFSVFTQEQGDFTYPHLYLNLGTVLHFSICQYCFTKVLFIVHGALSLLYK